jgi:hypothetical protein
MKVKIIIILVITFLFISIALFSMKFNNQAIRQYPIQDVCSGIDFPGIRSICEAAIVGDLKPCLDFSGKYLEICSKAVFSKLDVDEKFCTSISNRIAKDMCLRKLAFKNKNISLCSADICYFAISTPESCNLINNNDFLRKICLAKATKNLNYCKEIEDEDERIVCESLFSNSVEKCRSSSGYLVPTCVELVAKNSRNPNYCLSLHSEYLVAKCAALSIRNIEDCNKLEEAPRGLCKVIFMGRELYEIYE